MISALEALEKLRKGNQDYVDGVMDPNLYPNKYRRAELLKGQEPFAIIVGCSDSRSPAEILFNQGLGDLFVIRVAGNIVAPSQVGSVEFGVEHFGTRLVVVLGHSDCGAVKATVEEVQTPHNEIYSNLASIINRIRPSVTELVLSNKDTDQEQLVEQAIRSNIRSSADHLRHGSRILEDLVENDGLLIVGAEYSLETGLVDFFDGLPA